MLDDIAALDQPAAERNPPRSARLSDFDLDGFLPYRLAVLSARISRDFSRRYNERFGISRPEWRVVAQLARTGPASVGEIHRQVALDKSRVSRAASRLEALGYVRRDAHPEDGRLVRLSLTGAGRRMMAELAEMAADYQADLMARLGPGAEGFTAGMERIAARRE